MCGYPQIEGRWAGCHIQKAIQRHSFSHVGPMFTPVGSRCSKIMERCWGSNVCRSEKCERGHTKKQAESTYLGHMLAQPNLERQKVREGWRKIGGQKLDSHESKITSWSDLVAATSARAKSARGSHKIEAESTQLGRMLAQPHLGRQKMREG